MTGFEPDVRSAPVTLSDDPPGVPAECRHRRRELGRLVWSRGDAGEPAGLLEDFLAAYGLPVRDLAQPAPHDPDGAVCGAAVLLSAGAGAALVGAREAASPAPVVPDLVAVVYGHDLSIDPAVNSGAGWWVGPWSPSWTPAAHAGAVAEVREAIARGDVYQVNVVGHASAPYRGDPMPALRRVAALPGARYGGLLTGGPPAAGGGPGAPGGGPLGVDGRPAGGGWAVACASPETLVEVAGGRVVTRPVKGTRPATVAGRAELLASAKERAEHVMIVDLERNDLARVAATGSVRVDTLFAVRRWCGLWQAESTVSARLVPGTGLAALLRAVCPGGSVTGAPKLAALDLIAGLEPVGRGPSMGAFGWVGPDRVDLGLTIRTVAADGQRLHVWAGGGITWGSDPDAEVAEAAAKAGPLRAALV
jgi:para-aminobenzoate synthetase component I